MLVFCDTLDSCEHNLCFYTDSLSSTKRKGTEGKASLLQEVRDCCDQYEHVFVFSVENMRNNKLKEVRAHWKTSR